MWRLVTALAAGTRGVRGGVGKTENATRGSVVDGWHASAA